MYLKNPQQMIMGGEMLHKVDDGSKSIHAIVFKIKSTIISDKLKGKCQMCQNRTPKLFSNCN